MTKVDQFESVFRSAVKDVFEFRKPKLENMFVVTDLPDSSAMEYVKLVKKFIRTMQAENNTQWEYLNGNNFTTTQDLLTAVSNAKPDLILTYRNLHSRAWKYPYSLGEHLDVLINTTDVPVMVLPNPNADVGLDHAMKNTNVVMAMTDRLSNDHDLVNYAVNFTQENGRLYLVHIEDAETFAHYIQMISKIESIDTEEAEEKIHAQLLKEPRHFIHTVQQKLATLGVPIKIEPIVDFGHHLTEFRHYIAEYKVDLLVLNTKDKQQMAMHGLAYPLAVELINIPLLLI